MYLQPLQSSERSEIRICGDVRVHPSASIAPGVILQAAPDSYIEIGSDACIGMGTIITAYGGAVEIETGVTLGSGVLIVGNSKISSNACIGTASTVINASIEAMQVVNPGSLIGDRSRQIEPNSSEVQHDGHQDSNQESIAAKEKAESNGKASYSPQIEEIKIKEVKLDLETKETIDPSDPWTESVQKEKEPQDSNKVVEIAVKEVKDNLKTNDDTTIGRVYIDQLLVKLFPHRKSLSKSLNPDNTES